MAAAEVTEVDAEEFGAPVFCDDGGAAMVADEAVGAAGAAAIGADVVVIEVAELKLAVGTATVDCVEE